MNLKIIDSLSFVKKNKAIFFNKEDIDNLDLINRVILDPISLGATPIVVDIVFGWNIIASKKNWLKIDTNLSTKELFQSLVSNPKAGQNASRNEILLTAFSNNVITNGDGDLVLIRGLVSDFEKNAILEKYISFTFIAFN